MHGAGQVARGAADLGHVELLVQPVGICGGQINELRAVGDLCRRPQLYFTLFAIQLRHKQHVSADLAAEPRWAVAVSPHWDRIASATGILVYTAADVAIGRLRTGRAFPWFHGILLALLKRIWLVIQLQ